MDAARAAVDRITSRRGHHTEVDEIVNPAITSETIKPHRHEEVQEAIDREVHQHHYHTTVQPLAHRETLPERHEHNILPVVEKVFRHDNEAETQKRVSMELGQFQNSTVVAPTRESKAALPAVIGEHVHHHVHETVQPVLHKEVYQPEIIHTTVPIHEVHHIAAQHHGISALPMKTMAEFTSAGGLLTGSQKQTHEEYDGAPRPYNEKLMTTIDRVLPGHHHHSGHSTVSGANPTSTTAMTGNSVRDNNTMTINSGTAATTGMIGNDKVDGVSRHSRPDSAIGDMTGRPSTGSRV